MSNQLANEVDPVIKHGTKPVIITDSSPANSFMN